MKNNLAAILILLLALIGQASASVLPRACAHTPAGMSAEMSMDAMSIQKGGPDAAKSALKSGADDCDCCLSAGSSCTLGGCFAAALPTTPISIHAPALPLPAASAIHFRIPASPLAPHFRPPIA